MNSIVELIKETFHPNPYPFVEKNIDGTLLHLSRWGTGKYKYILLVIGINTNNNLKSLIQSQKKALKEYYRSSISKRIGMIEIVIGSHADWKNGILEVKPDWHGLQSILLQGLLFIDPEEKKYDLSQSHWGPFTFGNFHGQMDKVHYLLGQIGA